MTDNAPDSLLSFLHNEAERARQYRKDDEIADNIDLYRGELLGNEVDGRSKAVTRDVAEVTDQAVVNILETMVSGDRVVTFETDEDEELEGEGDPEGVEPPDFGNEATEAVAYQFMRKQGGYLLLHGACKAGLLERCGVVKTFVERKFKVETFSVPAIIFNDPDFEYLSASPRNDTHPNFETGDPLGQIYDVKRKVALPPVVKDVTVPLDEFDICTDARDHETARYQSHSRPMSLSGLREMGFEFEEAELYDAIRETELTRARDREVQLYGAQTGANRVVLLREEYVLYDADGDGINERLCIHRVGNKILSMEEVDSQPFNSWSPYPMQHRWAGDSLADKTKDIQIINTALLRNGLDSLYTTQLPRTAISEDSIGATTIDDMLNMQPGAIIRYRGPVAPQPMITADTSGTAFQAIEFMLSQRDSRTGINRHSAGLNPDSLNKTASGMAMLQDNGDKMLKYLARNFAEMLVAPMFSRRYHLMRAFVQPFRMKIDGRRVMVDPSQWPEETDVQINVGLGSNRREQRVQGRMTLLGVQKEAMMAQLPIVKPVHIYNSIKGLVRDLSLGSHSDFAEDPNEIEEPQQEAPGADVIKAQGDAQAKQAKIASEHELSSIRLQLAEQEARARDELARVSEENHQNIQRARAEFEAELARERLAFEQDMALARASLVGLPNDRPGGSLAQ